MGESWLFRVVCAPTSNTNQVCVFSHLPAPRPSPHPSVHVSLKECEGKRPYRIYIADAKKMDAFAYSIVNRDQVHMLRWNSTGIHSLKMSRATFAALPQRSVFLYLGRSTQGQRQACTVREGAGMSHLVTWVHPGVCLFSAESVSDLVSNPTKVERVARCQQACAQLIVSLLAPSMQPVRLEDC